MKRFKTLPSEPVLDGEVLPPASASTASLDEMTPEQFLAAHGIKPPRPKSYRTFEDAMVAVIRDVANTKL